MDVTDAINRAKAIAARLAIPQDNKRSLEDISNDPRKRYSQQSPTTPQQSQFYPQRKTIDINIPSQYINLIIGKNNETLKLLERSASIKIIVSNPDNPVERKISLNGEDADIQRARGYIKDIISTGSIPLALLGPKGDTFAMQVPGNKVGLVIGKGGETIQSLQLRSGAKIVVEQDANTDRSATGIRIVNITGDDESIERAKALINQVTGLSQQNMGGQGSLTEVLKIANDKVGLVIGKGGETIRSLQQQIGCRIVIEQPSGGPERDIVLSGSQIQVDAAKNAIYEKIGMSPVGMGANEYNEEEDLSEYTMDDFRTYCQWYKAATGQDYPGSEVFNDDDDIAAPGMSAPGMNAPPGMSAPPGIGAPPGMGAPPGIGAPPGMGMRPTPTLSAPPSGKYKTGN